MSGRNPTKRSDEENCERCGNPPPVWRKQMVKGERVKWLCRRCIHTSEEARRHNLEYAMLDVPECNCCGQEFSKLDKRYADVLPGGNLRGIICADCRKIIKASNRSIRWILRVLHYMSEER